MQRYFFIITVLFILSSLSYKADFKNTPNPVFFSPFQGKKIFCSTTNSNKAFVLIKGNQVTILIGNHKITGVYKSSKILLTNDPDEIEYRRSAGRYHYGTYYVITKNYLSKLESENGEYAYTYELCK